MNNNTGSKMLDKKVREMLQAAVDRGEYIQLMVFYPKEPRNSVSSLVDGIDAVNVRAIKLLQHDFGYSASDDMESQQISSWMSLVSAVGNSFQSLDKGSALKGINNMLRANRLVLDIEVGGFIFGVVGTEGWLFAATLNQQAMNSGEAENLFIDVAGVLEQTIQSDTIQTDKASG
jgi:hypothetical protein